MQTMTIAQLREIRSNPKGEVFTSVREAWDANETIGTIRQIIENLTGLTVCTLDVPFLMVNYEKQEVSNGLAN